jgi:hypothetical protein
MCYNSVTLNSKTTTEELLETFIKKGGKIDKFYLQSWNRSKPALVYLKGWFRGRNFKDAISKALGV